MSSDHNVSTTVLDYFTSLFREKLCVWEQSMALEGIQITIEFDKISADVKIPQSIKIKTK